MTRRSLRSGFAVLTLSLITTPLWAIVPPEGESQVRLGSARFETPGLSVEPTLDIREVGAVRAANYPGANAFFAAYSDQWEFRTDLRNNRPNLIQGVGVPLIPGKGNQLASRGKVTLAEVERAIRQFLAAHPDLLGVQGYDLRLDASRSLEYGGYFWNVEFQQFHRGVPVEDAHVFFRINHGNLVQFGVNRVADVAVDTVPALTGEQALQTLVGVIGLENAVGDRQVDGALKLFPLAAEGDQVAEAFAGVPGFGYRHVLAYEHVFTPAGSDEPLRALVDAKTGEVLDLRSEVRYATVTGQIYPTTNTDPLQTVGMPYTTVTNTTTKTTDASGVYSYGSGTATAKLNGKYINISDACGTISLSASSPGNLSFGGSTGTNCTTPGVGGAGNTHSARSGYYHLTRINRKAATFLPTNTWLAGTLTANMNINNTCNAFWNGSTVNFYRSGGGCSNTGEIAAVFLHEWGHGMDTKSGGAASEYGSGEAVGDTFAFLETKVSCIGANFQPGVQCYNCSSCTGVRDMAPFSNGGTKTIAKPANVTSNTGINCDRYACPYTTPSGFAYRGPMGYEGHCESYIASTANWDLSKNLIAKWGTTTGWQKMDKIWYASLTPSKSAYRVASGGTCNAAASVDGCGSTNWYTVFLPADDDDGNLANGTPNACRIWDAFNAHGIACGTRPTCTVP